MHLLRITTVSVQLRKMQQRKRLSGAVELGTADLCETAFEIKCQRTRILFVDVHLQTSLERDGMVDQLPADAVSMMRRIDEQHFEICAIQPGKAQQLAVIAFCDVDFQRRYVQIPQPWLEEADVILGQEMMRGAHGGKPDIDQARSIALGVGSYFHV